MSHDDPIAAAADVLAAHRLTFWSVYHWKDGGWSAAPRCTCGVLWSAGNQDAPGAQIAMHEAHVAQALADANLLTGDDTVRAAKAEALREAADEWTQGKWSDVMLPKPKPPAVPFIAYANAMGDWLRNRAAALTEGSDRD